jgi:benzoate-CoA ligase family protein
MNVATQLENLARQEGWLDRVAFVEGDRRFTHGEIHQLAARAAAGMAARGVRQGDRVLLALPDGGGLVASFLGAAFIGAVAVIVNPALTAGDHARIVADCRPRLVIAGDELTDRFEDLVSSTPERLLVADPDAALPAPADLDVDAPLYVQYTSGTTGRPKGAVHTHGHVAFYRRCIARGVLDIGPDDVILSVSKIYFAYGFGNALVFPLACGASAVLFAARPSPGEVGAAVRDHGVTLLFGVPSFYAKLVNACAPEEFSTVRAAVSAGEGLPRSAGERLTRFLGAPVLEQIGSTEAGHAFCANTVHSNVLGTLGRPVPEFELELRDSAGGVVPDGTVGELWVRGPSVMTGYLSESGTAAPLLADGWLNTRDRAIRNSDGTYTHCGRTDDIEIVGGINVAPTEIEAVISRHPDVREVAVAAVLSDDGTTTLSAFVVLETAGIDAAALRADLAALARSQLAPFKVPKSVRLVNELPRTDTGKLRRFMLRRDPSDSGAGAG